MKEKKPFPLLMIVGACESVGSLVCVEDVCGYEKKEMTITLVKKWPELN
jgi:hypothetical protein